LPSVGAQFIEPVLAELSLCSYKLLFGNPATSILIRARGFASHPFGVVCLYRSNYSIFKDYLKMFPNALFMFYLALIIYNKKEAELSNFRTPPSAFHRKCGLIIRLDSSVTRLSPIYIKDPWLCVPPFRYGLPLSEFVFYFRYYVITTFLNCQGQNCKFYPSKNSLFFNQYFNRPAVANIAPEILNPNSQVPNTFPKLFRIKS